MSEREDAERIPPVEEYDCRHGRFVVPTADQYIAQSLNLYGEYSEREVDLFARIVGRGATVVEGGAHIGALSVPLGKRIGASGRLICFEPQYLLWQMLAHNLRSNGISHGEAVHAALGDRDGTIKVPSLDYTELNNFGNVSLIEPRWIDAEGYDVPLQRLDSLGMRRLDFLKIDTEGMEAQVLDGAVETLRRCLPTVYFENLSGQTDGPVAQLFRQWGYQLWWHRPLLFNPQNWRGQPHNLFGDTRSHNILALPPGSTPLEPIPDLVLA
ncbi:MAG: FkbM family methyltransferase [Proteobacteria bacterium]|nr:FkbM family methyltransferase [Pseudomonadota bacterium]